LRFHAARTYAGGDAVVSDSQLIVTGCAIPGVLLNWVVTRVSFLRATTKVSGTDSCGFLDEISAVMMTRERRAYDECSILDVRGISGGGKELPRTTDPNQITSYSSFRSRFRSSYPKQNDRCDSVLVLYMAGDTAQLSSEMMI
jgi:hypothetical protein